MRERRRPPNDDARFIMEEDKPVLQKQEAIRLLFLRSKKCDWGTSRTTFPSSTEEKNATSGESAAVPCRARRPRRAAQQHQRRAVTSGQSAAFHCRGRRPRRPRSSTKVKFPRPANSQHLIAGKGLALSAQHMARHGKTWANALHARGFARGRRTSGHSLPEGASPFPTGRRLRIRPKARETGTLLRGAPGSARPTTWADAPYGADADSPDGLLPFRAAARNAGDGVPYLACADLPYVESSHCRVLRGSATGWTPPPTRPLRAFPHFLPPAGEGGIRRSPARRMTEEGEPHRLQTVKPLLFPAAGGHFHSAVPSRSPSPVALVGDTLPRWGRDRERALWSCHRGRFSLTTFSHGKRKTCHPAPSPPPPPANPRVFCRRLFLANSPRIRYNIPASGRGRGCPLFVFRSSASLRPRRGGAISLSHRSVISYV